MKIKCSIFLLLTMFDNVVLNVRYDDMIALLIYIYTYKEKQCKFNVVLICIYIYIIQEIFTLKSLVYICL
jgi:hypothetical protein